MRFSIFILLFTYNYLQAQNEFNFVYVDFNRTHNVNLLKETLQNQLNDISSSFILFLSNEPKPFIARNKTDVYKVLDELNIQTPSRPDFKQEYDTISSIISSNDFYYKYTDENLLPLKFERIIFNFYIDAKQCVDFSEAKYFIYRLMLTNGLVQNGVLRNNVLVNIYFEKKEYDNLIIEEKFMLTNEFKKYGYTQNEY